MHTGQRKYNAYSNKSHPAELAPDLSLLQFKWKKPGKGKQIFTRRARWNTTITATCSKLGECLLIHSHLAGHFVEVTVQ